MINVSSVTEKKPIGTYIPLHHPRCSESASMPMPERQMELNIHLGQAALTSDRIPVTLPHQAVIDECIELDGYSQRITCVSLRGPHCIIFSEDLNDLDLEKLAPPLEKAPIFPEQTSVVFVRVIGWNALRIRVWQRGVGEVSTSHPGIGAAAVAAVLRGFCGKEQDITVKLADAEWLVCYQADGSVNLTRPAATYLS